MYFHSKKNVSVLIKTLLSISCQITAWLQRKSGRVVDLFLAGTTMLPPKNVSSSYLEAAGRTGTITSWKKSANLPALAHTAQVFIDLFISIALSIYLFLQFTEVGNAEFIRAYF